MEKTANSIWDRPDSIMDAISQNDPVMKDLVERVGKIDLKPGGDYFESIVQSIIYQQIAGSAAASIYGKLVEAVRSEMVPGNLNELSDDQIRKCGVSPQKLRYLRDLTEKVISGNLDLDSIHKLNDNEIIEELTKVKGIGVWTAQMFLIFTLGRPDVFPSRDLGIQNAMKKQYRIRGKVTEARITRIARKWSPYRTAATWFLWKSENMKLPVVVNRKK